MTVFHTARITLPHVFFFATAGCGPRSALFPKLHFQLRTRSSRLFRRSFFVGAAESCCARLFEHESARYLSRRRHCHDMVLHLNENFKNSLRKRSWKVKMRPKPHGEFIRWCEFWGETKSDVSFSLNALIQSLMAHQTMAWSNTTNHLMTICWTSVFQSNFGSKR